LKHARSGWRIVLTMSRVEPGSSTGMRLWLSGLSWAKFWSARPLRWTLRASRECPLRPKADIGEASVAHSSEASGQDDWDKFSRVWRASNIGPKRYLHLTWRWRDTVPSPGNPLPMHQVTCLGARSCASNPGA